MNPEDFDRRNLTLTTPWGKLTFRLRPPDAVDLADIARRKEQLSAARAALTAQPEDEMCALRLVFAAIEADQVEEIAPLMDNQRLIASSARLLQLVDSDTAVRVLLRWADYLRKQGCPSGCETVLEGMVPQQGGRSDVREALRQHHYSAAQGYDTPGKAKPAPAVRIAHLQRIVDLGFELNYVHKLLAEAYHALGDDSKARTELIRALSIDPRGLGAVKIARALGLALPDAALAPKRASGTAPSEGSIAKAAAPSPREIRSWASGGDWDAVLAFANPAAYGTTARPREALQAIAAVLADLDAARAVPALENLLDSAYWEVQVTCLASLAKTGDRRALAVLERATAGNSTEVAARTAAIEYLRCRLEGSYSHAVPCPQTLVQARQLVLGGHIGAGRALCERLLSIDAPNDATRRTLAMTLAEACDEMGDHETAVSLVEQELQCLPGQSPVDVNPKLAFYLWDLLAGASYDPDQDARYVLALNCTLDGALRSTLPEDVVAPLRRLTRWLELLGEDDLCTRLRAAIRLLAPGSWEVDRADRSRYVRHIDQSCQLREGVRAFRTRLAGELLPKLARVFGASDELARVMTLFLEVGSEHEA